MQDELDEKATTEALTSGLAGKADTSHTHTIADVTGLQDELDGKAASDHNHDYTINGKAVSSNPVLAGTDIQIGTFNLSTAENDDLMPVSTDTVTGVLGKVFKAILDNEEVASAALIALNKVLGVSGTNSAMPDLSGTQYLSGLTNFVDIAKKLDESIYKFTDGGTITQAANASATPEVPSANRTADYITLDYKYSATTTRTIPELVNLGFFADRNNKIQYLLITNTGNSSAVLNITPGTGYSCNFATLTINAGYAVELSVYKNTVIASDGFLKR